MRKVVIYLIMIAVLIAGGLFFKNKFFGAQHRFDLASAEVSRLLSENKLQDGDLIFQTSLSNQSRAIQLATHSEYSHCGIIYRDGKEFFVLEAVQPVKTTPLTQWVARGKDGNYVIRRLKNSSTILTADALNKMKEVGKSFIGKNYDLTFEWSDDKIYCSELIWKIYNRATGLEIGKLQKLSDFDLSNDAVKKVMQQRYKDNIPLNETVISPVAVFESDLLETVN